MKAQPVAGWIAALSGVGLLLILVISSVGALVSGALGWTTATGSVAAPGRWAMGGGFGPGMMGGGMGPGMMGQEHMGFGYGSQGTGTPIAGAPTVTVTATEFAFSLVEITPASGEADLSLVNKGAVVHDVTVPALGIRIVAAAGQTTTVGLRNLPAGTYAGYCSVPGHADAGMRIGVVVK